MVVNVMVKAVEQYSLVHSHKNHLTSEVEAYLTVCDQATCFITCKCGVCFDNSRCLLRCVSRGLHKCSIKEKKYTPSLLYSKIYSYW